MDDDDDVRFVRLCAWCRHGARDTCDKRGVKQELTMMNFSFAIVSPLTSFAASHVHSFNSFLQLNTQQPRTNHTTTHLSKRQSKTQVSSTPSSSMDVLQPRRRHQHDLRRAQLQWSQYQEGNREKRLAG